MARVKQKLKETGGSSQQKRESFTKLFATAQNLPAVPEQPALSKLTSPSELQSNNQQEKSVTKTLAASVPTPAPQTVLRKKKAPKANGVSSGWFLLVPAIGLTTFVLLSPGDPTSEVKLSDRPIAEY
ncbi:MAG TPA: hypothetical protein VM432_00605, partial [Bdellovibrionales bacterium]|nr:hypothetical protein [Bdellovibrionales bacterium]